MNEEEILTLLKDYTGRLTIQSECKDDYWVDTFQVSEVLERIIVEELKKHKFRGAIKIIHSCDR
ncbi:unnamed protein product [marine sediment metagenome]|uniref:Uncharacterized protein n=1 Tax=marine sediment metagenome TaxID=412755 RepID=X1VDY1_9ZZZZ